MADFLDSEAEESGQESDEEVVGQPERKKPKRKTVQSDDEEDDEDDEERLREELKDLIDDAPIDESGSDAEDSDASGGPKKRKKSDDELDDRLEDEDYDLIEENLGVKVQRKKFKRLRRIQDDESDGEQQEDDGLDREVIADQLFVGGSDDEDEHKSERSHQKEQETFDEEQSDADYSDADDFIVDDDGRPIAEKKKKRKPIFTDASLQEGQDIFGVDFDYDEFEKYEDDEYEEDEDDLDDYIEDEDEGEARARKAKKTKAKRSTRKSIFEIYEPSELKRGHFTDLDNEIRNTDIPERMQIREVPVTPTAEGSNELEDESEWIYRQAFLKPSISKQDGPEGRERSRKGSQTIGKIRTALDYMRNQTLEVPFIAFYRKEYVQPELNINDLWKIYRFDAKWCQLKSRKENLLKLFDKMRNYQLDQLMLNPDAPIPENVRIIKDDDIDRLKLVQTTEELKDVHAHFLLYYSPDIPKMQEAWKAREKEKAKETRRAMRRLALEAQADEGVDVEEPEEEEEVVEETHPETLKQAVRGGPYTMCRKAGLDGFVKKFGLSPEQFAENLRDNYQRHEVEQDPNEPLTTAEQYVCEKFPVASDVIHAAKYMAAAQLAKEPLLRSSVREVFYERCKITVIPTKKGIKEIDENHQCYTMKFIKSKPVRDLTGDQFLKLSMAEDDKLITLTLSDNIEGNTSSSYLEEVKQLFQKDEFAKNVQDWNKIRADCVSVALSQMVLPDLRKELRAQLLAEARESILKACCRKLYNWIKVAPYSVEFPDEDDDDWVTSKGLRIMGLAYVPDFSQAAFCCVIAPDSEVIDHLRLQHLLKRKNSYNNSDKYRKESDLNALRNFIMTKKPHAIVVGGESRDAIMIKADLNDVISQLVEDEQFPRIPVEISDNLLPKIYANSNKGLADFREYPEVLRQAVSLARVLQDPLVEYSQLCTVDEELLCLRFHPLQDQIPKEELIENLYLEFVNRTNEVGVDINTAVQTGLTVNLVQFICGLGPRKGQALIKMLKQTNQRLENRTQLVTGCHMGPKVFINCSGFIKIDTNSLGDSTEAYVEVLDGSRVHPETYEWARKMAVDALEYEDEEANPAGALEEILDAPERLKDLDLDAFAEELERQGFGNKSITLYDIRAELNHRYKDLRVQYKAPNPGEVFDILTKETPETLYIGKMVMATVVGISHRKPAKEHLDLANPIRNDETGMWECQFCKKNDFPELSEVWNHFDAGACPGQATGVRVRLDNGLTGYIHVKNLSDKHVDDPAERVRSGQTIFCRVIKIDVERFSVECSCKSSDLLDKNNDWRPGKDPFYDQELEDKENKKELDAKQVKQRQQYTKRVIVHPSFHNISYSQSEKLLASMDQGEAIIRPSSKGDDHLTVTWKVTEGIYQHIDVREEGKENAYSLGTSLWIGNDEFEDLDEIIARHVNPMAAHARDLIAFKYFKDLGGIRDKAEEALREEKKKNSNKIHYFLSAAKSFPGKFLLSYLPVQRCKHEYVTVTPDGFRFRQQVFESVSGLLRWFKEHFKDPIPIATPSTPRGSSASVRTPYQPHTPGAGMTSDAIQRVAQNMPSHMLHSLSQVATYPHTPAMYINTPYTPSAQTPYMTPYGTPHGTPQQIPTTPRPTPNASSDGFLHPGAVTPRRHQPSPATHYSSSHYGNQYQHSSNSSNRPAPSYNNEPTDWQKAAEAWAKLQNKDGSTPRSEGRNTPRGSTSRTPRYDDSSIGRRTPQYDSRNPQPSPGGRSSRQSGHHSSRSPRSARSTPYTNTSPRSMSIGDATPLYDEN